MGVMAVAKLLFGYYQVLVLIGSVYSVPYPPVYLEVLEGFTKMFSLNVFTIFPLECVQQYDFYYPFYFTCISSMALLGLIVCLQLFTSTPKHNRQTKIDSNQDGVVSRTEMCGCVNARMQDAQAWLLFITYFIYSSTCAMISNIFNCVDLNDGNVLLITDYSISCKSSAYASAKYLGIAATLSVSLGTPLLYGLLMFPHRANIRAARHLGFFYADYTDDYWYWEIIECIKRLLLTGGSIFFFKGSLLQIVVSIILVSMYAFVIDHVRPFALKINNTQAVLANHMLALSLFLALLLKISIGFKPTGLYDIGIPEQALPYLMIGSLLAVLISYASMLLWGWIGSHSAVSKTDSAIYDAFNFVDLDKSMQRSAMGNGTVVLEEEQPTKDSRALEMLLRFIRANEPPFNDHKGTSMHIGHDDKIRVSKIAVVQCSKRIQSFVNKHLEYESKYTNPVFRMTWLSEQSDAKLMLWRLEIIRYFGRYPSYGPSSSHGDWACGKVRVSVAFRGECDESVAKSILQGNLSNLAARDPGYYGTGLYFSLDPEYCVRYYGTDKNGDPFPERVLAIYAVVFGNAYPVTEAITEKDRSGVEKAKKAAIQRSGDINYCSQDSLLGRPLKAKSDSHLVVVGVDGQHPDTTKGVWRKMPPGHQFHGHAFQAPVDPSEQRGFGGLVRSELVVRDESQVMPLGYMVIASHGNTSMGMGAEGANQKFVL